MNFARAIARSYRFARNTWLFPRYGTSSALLLTAAFPFFFAHYPSPFYFYTFAASYFGFAGWAKRSHSDTADADVRPTAI